MSVSGVTWFRPCDAEIGVTGDGDGGYASLGEGHGRGDGDLGNRDGEGFGDDGDLTGGGGRGPVNESTAKDGVLDHGKGLTLSTRPLPPAVARARRHAKIDEALKHLENL